MTRPMMPGPDWVIEEFKGTARIITVCRQAIRDERLLDEVRCYVGVPEYGKIDCAAMDVSSFWR